VFQEISQIVHQKRDSKEPISLAIIQQLLYNKTDEILEVSENAMFEGSISKLNILNNDLSTTVDKVSEDSKATKSKWQSFHSIHDEPFTHPFIIVASGTSPWLQRASDLKAEVVVNHDMERKLQQHIDEIHKLIKDVKMKDQSLQESAVKIELLEKRMEGAKKQGEQIAELESGLSKSQSQMQMYAEAMENLQAEYDTLEQENIQLKKAAAKRNEKQSSASKSSEYAEGNANNSEELVTTETYAMKTRLDSLSSAVRYLRAENAHLKSKEYMAILKLNELPELIDNESNEKEVKQNKLRSIALESKALIRDIRNVSATSKVIKLQPAQAGKWRSQKLAAEYQFQQQQSVLHTLQKRSSELRHKVDAMQQSLPHKRISQPKTSSDAAAAFALARIQIPKIPQLQALQYGHKNINLKSFNEFEKVHSVFVR
jgi:chromosome segregation ATPase